MHGLIKWEKKKKRQSFICIGSTRKGGRFVWVFINVRLHINRYCLWQAAATSNDDGEQTSAITVGLCRSAREQPLAASATCWLFPPRIQLVNRAKVSNITVFMTAAPSCSCDLVNEWGNEADVHSRNCQRRPNIASETSSINIASDVNPLNPELNPICYLLALLGAHHFLHVRRIRVKLLTFRLLMSYIYWAPILDVSRSHTTTQHSR